MFLETSWDKSHLVKKNYADNDGKYINHFEIIDSKEFKHILAFDKSQPSLRVFAKVSRAIARRHLATTKNINLIRWFALAIIGAKPNVTRGKKCYSVNDGYAIIKERPN